MKINLSSHFIDEVEEENENIRPSDATTIK